MSALQWNISSNTTSGELEVELAGSITEKSQIADFIDILKGHSFSRLKIDLSKISEVNSTGIAGWMKFIEYHKQENIDLVFVDVSITIVQQLNMIKQFLGNAHLESFQAPYYCSSCKKESTVTIQIPNEKKVELATELPCENCGHQKEFDEIIDSYLSFQEAS